MLLLNVLFDIGKKDEKNCARVPKVCELIDRIPPAKSCTRGQVRKQSCLYSVMMTMIVMMTAQQGFLLCIVDKILSDEARSSCVAPLWTD
jgi:hypothetical protein